MKRPATNIKSLNAGIPIYRGKKSNAPANALTTLKPNNPLTGLNGMNKMAIDPIKEPIKVTASRIPKS